ncbi:MAG: hypothetical protein KAJ45_06310 [Desulfobulbaceae bacterium]|nr:hypothetical protein [Desulfobulbaceae bacterium]
MTTHNFMGVPYLGNQEIEAINKHNRFFKQSTRPTGKGKYGKGSHSFDILENLDPQKVQNASPWAKRLIDELCERV